ncbi:MAG: T9SS type A sorting domain-containing protein [Candidatus Eisenbacteria bacterium]|nr:T9SS type A sorting domain-containing protein [Candidatus Eisenbacteria bacterium]
MLRLPSPSALALALVLTLPSAPVHAQIGIEHIPTVDAKHVLAGDVDGDGFKEIVAVEAVEYTPVYSVRAQVYKRRGIRWELLDSFLLDVDWVNDRAQLLRRNGDTGPLDLVINKNSHGGLYVYQNDGTGHFASPPVVVPTPSDCAVQLPGALYVDPLRPSSGQFLVCAAWINGPVGAGLAWFPLPLGSASATLEATSGASPIQVAVADFDGDTRPDMWVGGLMERGPGWWPNQCMYRFGTGPGREMGAWQDLGLSSFGLDEYNPPHVSDADNDGDLDVQGGLGDAFSALPSQVGGMENGGGTDMMAYGGSLTGPQKRYSLIYKWADLNHDNLTDVVTLSLGRPVQTNFGFADSLGFTSFLGIAGLGISYDSQRVYDCHNSPNTDATSGFDLELADLDGDGNEDVALLTPGSITVYPGRGDGSFVFGPDAPAIRQLELGPEAARVLALADMDQDGHGEILVGLESPTNSLQRIEVDSLTSEFAVRQSVDAGVVVTHIAVGDLRMDGITDAVLGRGPNTIAVARLEGAPAYLSVTSYDEPLDGGSGAGEIRGLALTDVTGDSLPEIIVTSPGALGDHYEIDDVSNDPWYLPSLHYFQVSGGVTGCALGPWTTGTPQPDLIALFRDSSQVHYVEDPSPTGSLSNMVGRPGSIAPRTDSPHPFEMTFLGGTWPGYHMVVANAGSHEVSILRQYAPDTPVWVDFTTYPVAGEPVAVAIGDLNGDHVPDVAVACDAPSTLTIYYGDAAGGLTGRRDIPVVGVGPLRDVRIGDVTRDGSPDLVYLTSGAAFGGPAARPSGTRRTAALRSDLFAIDFRGDRPGVVGVGGPPAGGGRAGRVELSLAPNPMRGSGSVAFSMPTAGHMVLEVFDVSGRRVARVAEGMFPAGRHSLVIGPTVLGAAARSGVYFVRLQTPAGISTRRMVRVN